MKLLSTSTDASRLNLLPKAIIKGYRLSDKRTDTDATDEENAELRNRIWLFYYASVLRWEIVQDYMIETISQLQQTNWYKHDIKRWSKDIIKQMSKHSEVVMRMCPSEEQLDKLDIMKEMYYSKLSKHIDIMYYSILHQLEKDKAVNAPVLARLHTAFIILELSCRMMEQDKNTEDRDLALAIGNIHRIGMPDTTRLLENINDRVSKLQPRHSNIQTPQISLAMDVLCKEYANYGYIVEVMRNIQ